MIREEVIKIVCETDKSLTEEILNTLKKLKIYNITTQIAKSVVHREKEILFGMINKTVLEEDPNTIISFYVNKKDEEYVMKCIIDAGKLNIHGRGTIYSKNVEIIYNDIDFIDRNVNTDIKTNDYKLNTSLNGITCIVQRGQISHIANSVLDMGYSVPVITYGIGTGLRDKLGLLRITIPAEKEIIELYVPDQDTEDVFDFLIDIGKLDEPGNGFIYYSPIKSGIINMKVNRGKTRSAASIEQIINAIDDLKGGYEWRKRNTIQSIHSKRRYLTDFVNFNIVCNEGRGAELIEIAMDAGAGGATTYDAKYLNFNPDEKSKNKQVLVARQICNLVIAKNQVDTILDAIIKEGLFDNNTYGFVELSPIPKACTYLGKVSKK